MKRIRPLAWVIIILNVVLLYRLLVQFETDSDQYYQVGAFVGYMLLAGFMNVVLYIIFRITEKRNK
jgi:hypothetical protein